MAPPLNFQFSANQQSGRSYPLSLLKRESASVDSMHRASFITSSTVWLARRRILLPLQLIGWFSDQACLAIADLLVWHLTSCTRCHAFVERSTSDRPKVASKLGSKSTKMPALDARLTLTPVLLLIFQVTRKYCPDI